MLADEIEAVTETKRPILVNIDGEIRRATALGPSAYEEHAEGEESHERVSQDN